MKRTLIPLVPLLLLGQSFALDCGNLHRLGMGELGSPPNWMVPYCTAAAERLEASFKKSYPNQQFVQVYEAVIDGGKTVAASQFLNAIMKKAGYQYVSQTNTNGVLNLNYANLSKRAGYAVFIGPKQLDFFLVLVKTKL
ncbi:hypothetical protein [Deinococcus arenicola]|uniref:Uncharacterized protein n=1 Tax=Deinococcus arenicola TaxID=2994950 RepID=A0ABU4DRX3_9DEIO|nr:hypothetical protein [Deinococcus sp. ZS9-10]MDV6375186.1 hypothetical protein [Deinococcus sp. ZS9-10]